jgi:hypothetical protein
MFRPRRSGGSGSDAPPPRLLAIVPLIFAILSVPLALGLIEPDGLYGVRTDATLATHEAWYRINRISGIAGIAGGIAGMVTNAFILRSALKPLHRHAAVFWVAIGSAMALILPGTLIN